MDPMEDSYRQFLEGDEAAFTHIMLTYRDSLIDFLQGYLREESAAEDVAIDVFTWVLLHPNRYDFRSSLKTYLFMLGRSRALNYLRWRKRQAQVLPEWDLASEEPPEERLLAADRRRQVNEALKTLPTAMGEAVHLVYFEELSYREAAMVMKKTPKQVDNLLYRAKAKLRKLLGEELL